MAIIDWRKGAVHVVFVRRQRGAGSSPLPAGEYAPGAALGSELTLLMVSHPDLTAAERCSVLHPVRDAAAAAMFMTFSSTFAVMSMAADDALDGARSLTLAAAVGFAVVVGLLWRHSNLRAVRRVAASNPALSQVQKRRDLLAQAQLQDPDVIRHALEAQAALLNDPQGFGSAQHRAIWDWACRQQDEARQQRLAR